MTEIGVFKHTVCVGEPEERLIVEAVLRFIGVAEVMLPPLPGQDVEVVEKPEKLNGGVPEAGDVTVTVTDTLVPAESLPALPTDVRQIVLPEALPVQALPVLAVIFVAFATVNPEGMVMETPPMLLPLMFAVNLTLLASPAQKLELSKVRLNCDNALFIKRRFAIRRKIVNAKALRKETFIKRQVLSVQNEDAAGTDAFSL